MCRRSVSVFILVFTLLEFVVRTHLTSYSSHDFISGKHEKYLVDDFSSMQEGLAAEARNTPTNLNINYMLRFEPAFLDFKQRPLGVPHLEKVTLFNIDSNRTIDMTSISGSTVHFHSSFFEDKKIPPLGNTTFNVVFLGREEGSIESNLFIHTTEGHFQYQVKGASVYSPYRIRPIVGIKLPLNTTFSPLIYIHNPHSEPIQIVEMYSSGGDFHLELPTGELEGPKDMWEIPPLQTKAVIRVRFHSRTEQNHTAYVRIKLNNTEEILVVPLEVEVTVNAGIFAPQGSIDFGVGGSLDPPKQMKLLLHNPLKKAVRIHSVTSTSKAIRIQFENVRLPIDQKSGKNDIAFIEVATLTLDWKTAYSENDYSGKIIVKYKNGKNMVEIPYYVTVVEGGISFNASTTRYFISDRQEEIKLRNIVIKNDFLTPLALINVSLPVDAQKFFQITNFKPIVLKSKEESTIFSLKIKTGLHTMDLRIDSNILLKTNISDFEFPLLSYNGKLELHLPYKSKDNSLDLGLLSFDSKKETHILLLNKNPIKVTINKVFTSLPASQVTIVGCGKGDFSLALLQESFGNMTKCTYLRPSEYVILLLSVKTSQSEGQIWGDVSVATQYEQMSIPVHFRIAQGKLEIGPDRLVFDQCFPGKICSHPLRVHSTFSDSMVIEDILSIPPDKRVTSKHSGHILARATKVIGYLYLDPNIGCNSECYSGMNQESSNQWIKTLTLPKFTSDFDINLVNIFYNRYLNQTTNGSSKWQNLTIRLDTSEIKGHFFKTRVKMSWPSIIVDVPDNKSGYYFPLTQVGNITYRNITIRNPSSSNLVIQLVMDKFYPSMEALYEGLPPNFLPNYSEGLKKRRHDFFFKGSFAEKKEEFFKLTNFKVHEDSIPVILNPGENLTVTIGYKATDSITNSVHILLRNNLTVLEIIKLNGQGAIPVFKFGNRRPGSVLPLVFELTDKHLKDCEREKHRKYPAPNLSVKRTFTARNTGEVTVFVNSFIINGLACEGFGFKVLNCEPFVLPPNSTKKVDIAFTPDFTLAKITRTLVLETSLNVPVNYTLITTIPTFYLSLCASLLMRPTWELYLYYISLTSMCTLLVFVVFLPLVESEKIIKQTMGYLTRQSPPTEPLDLRAIGAQAKLEVRSTKAIEDSETVGVDAKISEKITCNKGAEEVKVPKEPEKYTVLVPTTGKTRRKLSKKNSSDYQEHEVKSKNWLETQRAHRSKVETLPKPQSIPTETTVVESNTSKKGNNRIDKKAKVEPKKLEEEETSSTTTESSNNEEIDVKPPKVPLKKSPTPTVKQEYCAKTPDPDQKGQQKLERKKSQPKTCPKRGENCETKPETKNKHEHKQKGNKPVRERKEKQGCLKKQNDKSTNNKLSESGNNSSSPTIRTSPTITTSSIWTENKASFSDVVARHDNITTNTPARGLTLTQTAQLTKPTVYVEPYKKTAADLGPIGSRRLDFLQDASSTSDRPLYPAEDQFSSKRFFSEVHNLAVESSNAFFDTNCWQSTNTVSPINPVHPTPSYNSSLGTRNLETPGDPWVSTGSPGFWDYNSPLESMQQRTPPIQNQQNGYIWGSSPIWHPWSPDSQRSTTTRTPPGFGPPSSQDLDEPQPQTYNPFGTNNIWTQQQQSNPWNFPQGQ